MEQKKKVIIATCLSVAVVAGCGYYFWKEGNGKTILSSNDGDSNVVIQATAENVDLDESDEKINWSSYGKHEVTLSETLTISSGGTYNLTGTISDGMIIVDTDEDVKLVLNGVSITNSNGPAIYVKSAETCIISTVSGTTNTLTDSSSYSGYDEDVEGAIYSKDDLVLEGEGTLVVTGKKGDGIVSKDDLKINSGTIKVDAADDGIRGKDSVYIIGGTIEIEAGSDGIKSTNDTDSGKGYVKITDGDITISAGDDGIHAEQQLVIDGGSIDVEKSYEGLESVDLIINGGDIKIKASDDGLNAAGGNDGSGISNSSGSDSSDFGNRRQGGGMMSSSTGTLTITGGNIYVNADGDGLDANGYIYISGGNIMVDGPQNSGNGALDYDSGCVITGGELIAVGSTGMAQGISSNSSQYGVLINLSSSYNGGSKVVLEDSNGNEVVSFTAGKSFSSVLISNEKLSTGEYSLKVDGSTVQSVTISSISSTSGSGSGMNGGMQQGGQAGGRMNGQNGGMKGR